MALGQVIGSVGGGGGGGNRGPDTQPPAQEEVKAEDRASIEGTVTNGRTDQPLKKALVQVARMESRTGPATVGVVTDAGGRFVIKDLDPGRYSIRISRTGFASADFRSQQRSSADAPSMITLKPRQEMKGLNYKLLPAAVITGRVVDDEGEPVANARVMCMRYQYMQGRRQLVPAGTMDGGGTDDTGQYRIFGLPAGRYYLSVAYFDYRSANTEIRGAGNETFGTVYYPGVLDATQASPLAIREGEERTGIDFKMIKTRTVRVRGRVVSETGRKPQFASVMLFNRGGSSFMQRSSAQVRPDGTFELRGVASGAYFLIAFGADAGEQLQFRQPIDVGNDNLDNVEGVLRSGMEIKGQVKLEDGAPDQPLDGVRLMLRPKEEGIMMGGGMGMVEKDGSFTMKRVQGGAYRIFISSSGEQQPFYVKSARFADQDATDGFTLGETAAPLEVVLSAGGGKLDGSVIDEKKKPAVGATVVLVPEGDNRSNSDLFKNASTDQNGHYTITGVKPGDYKLFAWDKVDSGSWQDPAFLEPFEAKGKKVKVDKNGYESIELEMLMAEEN